MASFFILKRPLEQDPLYFAQRFTKWQAWNDLRNLARFKAGTISVNNIAVPLQRGDVAYAIGTLGERWRWNWRTVQRFLTELEAEGRITFHSSRRTTTVIHIVNYDADQRSRDSEECGTENRLMTTDNIGLGEKTTETMQIPMHNPLQKNNKDKHKLQSTPKASDPNGDRVNVLHELFRTRFLEKTGVNYHVGYRKRELEDLHHLLQTYDYEQVQEIINAFFDTPDAWIIENHFPWGVLIKRASLLAAACAKYVRSMNQDIENAQALIKYLDTRKEVA